MEVGGGPDNAGGRGLVRGGGPIPNPWVAPTFIADVFCLRGRVGRPLPASAMVGSLDGCAGSCSSSLGILRLRDVMVGSDEENEAGILSGSSRSRVAFQTHGSHGPGRSGPASNSISAQTTHFHCLLEQRISQLLANR